MLAIEKTNVKNKGIVEKLLEPPGINYHLPMEMVISIYRICTWEQGTILSSNGSLPRINI